MLDNAMPQGCRIKKMVTPAERPSLICGTCSPNGGRVRVLGVDRTSVRYRVDRPDDAAVRARMGDLRQLAPAGSAIAVFLC